MFESKTNRVKEVGGGVLKWGMYVVVYMMYSVAEICGRCSVRLFSKYPSFSLVK